jgi:GDP-L-fucose synthase
LEQGTDDGLYNIGVGSDVTITELAEQIKQIVGFDGRFEYDTNMPDGAMRKMLDVSRLTKLGWQPQYSLAQGIAQTYQWYLQQNS